MPYDAEYWRNFIYEVAERTGRSPQDIIYDEILTRESVINEND